MFTRGLFTVAASVAVLPAAVAVVMMPAAAVGGLVLAMFVGAAAGLQARQAGSPAGDAVQVVAVRRAALRACGVSFAAWLVVIGLLVLFGPVGWIVILLVVLAAAPGWWARRRRGTRGTVAVGGGSTGVELSVQGIAALSTPQLCLAWRRSGRALLDTPAGPARDELVRIRGCLLDEIERRDHDGFTRWLEAGARAGSDPTRYLTTERGE